MNIFFYYRRVIAFVLSFLSLYETVGLYVDYDNYTLRKDTLQQEIKRMIYEWKIIHHAEKNEIPIFDNEIEAFLQNKIRKLKYRHGHLRSNYKIQKSHKENGLIKKYIILKGRVQYIHLIENLINDLSHSRYCNIVNIDVEKNSTNLQFTIEMEISAMENNV